jgi:hypothetical protein
MAATCHFGGDCRSGAGRIPGCAASHGPARHAESGALACAGLATTRDRDTSGGTRVGAALIRVSIARVNIACAAFTRVAAIRRPFITIAVIRSAFTTLAVFRAGTPHVAPSSATDTRNYITRAHTSGTALRATGTSGCIPFRRHTSRSIADPSSSCATKRGGPAERPNYERPSRNHHASCATRAACRHCACSADSTRTKH